MLLRRTMLALLAGLPLLSWPTLGAAADAPLKVVASFSILGDMVRQIGGRHVDLAMLVGPNGDAHVYEPTPADAKTIAAAQLLVINGLEFESWLPRLLHASGFAGETVQASTGIAPRSFADSHGHDEHGHDEHGHDEGHAHGPTDPHAWQSLTNGVIYARNIGAALAKADPAHADDYARATAAYVARLEALDAQVKTELGAIPAEQRRVVASHDAFGYFGDAYGVTFLAPLGPSTAAEASAAELGRIIDLIRDQDIKAVFVENISNTKLIEQVARETGATIGGDLYSDALSDADGPAPTYEKMFAWNAGQLVRALTGN